MPRKSLLEREKKRIKLYKKYNLKRLTLLNQLKNLNSLTEILDINNKLQKLPKNSSSTRIRNRCWKTGKSRGIFRFFGLCRNSFRELAHNCLLPGVTKASW